ncbi:hypothetical protein ACFL2W_00045 [Candidatus Omnitrophota bacterium]
MAQLQLDSLSPEVRKKTESYLTQLIDIYKDSIISINLYGSATGKDFSLKTSDINLLVVVNELSFGQLKKGLKFISQGIAKKIAAPLFLTEEHIRTSQDVFPIEFLEMKENHICLYGKDVLNDVDIKRDYIRLFCEEQIKGKLIRIRQAYLEIGLRKKGVEALMKESMYSLIPVFRNLLRLKGLGPSVLKEEVLLAVSAEFGLDQEVFITILKDKRDDEKIGGQDVEVYFEKYLDQIRKLAIAVDTL